MDKDKNRKNTITDEELEPYTSLFEGAYTAIDAKKNKGMVINQLAKDLKTAGYPPSKICRAICKKLTMVSLEDGKKYVNKDWIMRTLGPEYKDDIRSSIKRESDKERQLLAEKEKALISKKPAAEKPKQPKPLNEKLVKGIEAEIKKEIEIGKEQGLESAIELEEDLLSPPEIEVIENENETVYRDIVIDAPPPAVKGPTIKERTQEMQQQLNDLQVELTATQNKLIDAIDSHHAEHAELIQLREDYAKLLEEFNEVQQPFLERQWIQVNTLNAEGEKVPNIVEFDIAAYPITRRILIPIDTKKQTYKRKVSSLQEKEEHEKEWKRLTKGKMSFNVKVVKPKNHDETLAQA